MYLSIYAIMKTMCPPAYHHNGFVAIHALGYMMYGYTLLVPMNQRVLNKLSKEHIINDHKRSMTLIIRSLPSLLSILWFIGTSNM